MNANDRAYIEIAPSLLAANPLKFAEELSSAEKAGADLHHVDVMDGHFVPNLSFGLPLIKAFKSVADIPLDVHIMISNPDEMVDLYCDAGADILVFHVEAARHHHRIIEQIESKGVKPGISINPGTPNYSIEEMIEWVSVVNIMSVNPGFGGQKFITTALKKIEYARNLVEKKSLMTRIQVDGGVNEETVDRVRKAGANRLVAGTGFFKAADRQAAIANLRG